MSRRCLMAVTCRFANKKGKIDFDDFLQIYTRVVKLIGKCVALWQTSKWLIVNATKNKL